MYGFSGYGTNEYGSSREAGFLKKISAAVAQRTVVLFTNFAGTITAMTNYIRTVALATNHERNAIAMTHQIRTVEADENKSRIITIQ